MKLRKQDEAGFTLIELMVVVMIIAILIAIAVPTFLNVRTKAQDRAAESNLRNAFTAGKSVYADGQDYTAATDAALAAAEPSLTFVAGGVTSTGAKEVSVNPSASDTLILSALSASGKCFWIKDVTSAGGGTTYGSTPGAASCKGTDAPATGFVAQSVAW